MLSAIKLAIRITLVLFFIAISQLHSQIISFTLNGKVVDAQDGSPIELASVYISETAIFTETDALGNFQLFLPQKKIISLK
ncbi:MAG: carboxypeptidase-like regulatory domain-containing protein [Saprospiraceae bacterium]|nr:carboxypeptidase-like regulatory domain-containing protein [Saprospiraceae bacterium]